MTGHWANCSGVSIPEECFGTLQVVQRVNVGDAANIIQLDKRY